MVQEPDCHDVLASGGTDAPPVCLHRHCPVWAFAAFVKKHSDDKSISNFGYISPLCQVNTCPIQLLERDPGAMGNTDILQIHGLLDEQLCAEYLLQIRRSTDILMCMPDMNPTQLYCDVKKFRALHSCCEGTLHQTMRLGLTRL